MSDPISAPPAEPATRAPAAVRISGLPPTHPQRTDTPVFGFILLGGPLSGALVRDVRLANELAQRGYPVHVWWVMERRRSAQLHQSITERWLFNGMRYLRLVNSRGRTGSRLLTVTRPILDALGRLISRTFSDKRRSHFLQRRPWVLQRIMGDLLLHVCDGIDRDPQLIRRFARQLDDAGVTHLLPMLAALCPWADAAAKRMRQPAGFLVTFQGYELYANYARALGCERPLYDRFIELVDRSDWPAVAVSPDYVDRVVNDIGVARAKIRAIPPGVPIPAPLDRDEAKRQIATAFKSYRPDLPLLTFVGRCDTEKGIDLLLYATAILRQRGIDVQLAICGPTLFGTEYRHVCRQIAENLRCPVFWRRHIADEQRAALFAASDCVVYPSIHREPFGMVPVEAMSYGTPAVVPDHGGVAGVIEAEGKIAGVRFRVWDSGDLANQIQSLLQDRTRWQQLADAAPHVARYYSVANLADRILAHLNLPVKR